MIRDGHQVYTDQSLDMMNLSLGLPDVYTLCASLHYNVILSRRHEYALILPY